MKKQFLILFAFISVLALSQVPQRFNKVIVTGDITSPKFIKTGSTADSVLLGNGSARAISTIKTDTVSLSNRINAKATGSGTANGTNTGDETLSSIKTKLGAATAVSDGYLKYQDWSAFNSKEPAITKNTAFNKNFGTTTGTVLEGRTFGTAANSAVGDFIQNQNSTQQPANININGVGSFGDKVSFATDDPTVAGKIYGYNEPSTGLYGAGLKFQTRYWNGSAYVYEDKLTLNSTGAATFSSTVNSTGFLLNGNNLTSSLTTNSIPKWNGSNFVNSLISESVYGTIFGSNIVIGQGNDLTWGGYSNGYGTITSNGAILNVYPQGNLLTGTFIINSTTQSTAPTNGALVVGGGVGAAHVRANNFYGNGSNLTGIQLPITLTTNGTSGAATFSGNVLNVPNYTSSGSFIQNQTTTAQTGGLWVSGIIQTNNTLYAATVASNHVDVGEINITISGTSGNATFIQPFRGIAYKKVIINLNGFAGNVNWSYPTAFTNTPVILMTDGLASTLITSKSTTSVTVTSATATTGILILEGY